MKDTHKNDDLSAKIDLGVRRGVAQALAKHKKEGRSIYVWQDGKVVEILVSEIKYDKKLLNEKGCD
ncbi:hypothetical protein AYM02_05280 [Coxiella burnetii]|uniref:hypothetical protein n=1 Tax=Coxiella burnetii TaxID=777 RepID=UPI0002DC5A91|nr:hypothetical protein [Coxiella burnetii]AML48757.1 hypothetical protein AUR58_05880 [Coxiella burnetii]AML54727.1 hypothetical protein AYM38_05215 [Coxiella burnetii]ATN68692.1 hypothetical protein AYM00_05500 [Coxiella burnetii]ATN70618.1 hypothetical protein AYM02_05280 [Coxiella burnetii]ATN72542.1 hypothetical protein AYM11_05105 [Coxiella burnetii]